MCPWKPAVSLFGAQKRRIAFTLSAKESPQNVTHKTFYSELYNHEIGYNIYLPPDYEKNHKKYPVVYHLHGWMCNESTDIFTLEKIYSSRQSITVFPNNSPAIENMENLPVESMIFSEFIPYIENKYRIETTRENRSISGFSMGGGVAFYYAVKYIEMFTSLTAYAGTYHHFFHKDFETVGVASEKAVELYEKMMSEHEKLIGEARYFANNILYMISQNVKKIQGNLTIKIHVGTEDILFCDNEILHLHLNSLNIPHEYRVIEKAGHDLIKII